ncbi:gamma-glutamylputrescine oxidoreductase [Fusarium phyllophilum]|uniref:Gamma-glutamylputrescine oxidoreductase n=1 Tax=Fusarium phyllophilum TaxID=47803 RepID=A0A8H5JNQ1_9HYPO|nr:gamma-glutamylputrescine oxidoreductase [Fusarium phyllophilum]
MRRFLSILQEDRELAAYHPEPGTDRLYENTYRHVDKDMPCDKCSYDGKLVPRERLKQGVPEPRVHFGRIASGDAVMKSGEDSDDIARKLGLITGSIVLVPFPLIEDFVGRLDILDDLRQQLSPEKSYAVALFGLGVVGKTQIALAYVHELRAHSPDPSVFWAYASNELVHTGYYEEIVEHQSRSV